MTINHKPFSGTLRALMRAVKQEKEPYHIEFIKSILQPIYGYDLTLVDVHSITFRVYVEMLGIQEFKSGYDLEKHMMDMTKCLFEWPFYKNQPLTKEDILTKQITMMVGKLIVTDVLWCKEYLFYPASDN